MDMKLAASQPRLQDPGLGHEPVPGYALTHCQKGPFEPIASATTVRLGIFPSVARAEEAGREALHRRCLELYHQGHEGRYYDDLGLNKESTVTMFKSVFRDGFDIKHEGVVSWFRIEIVHLWDPSWEAEVHRCSEEDLFNSPPIEVSNKIQAIEKPRPAMSLLPFLKPDYTTPKSNTPLPAFMKTSSTEKPTPVVKLPAKPSHITAKPNASSPSPTKARYISELARVLLAEEQQVTWSGTCMPLPLSDSHFRSKTITQAIDHEVESQLEWSRSRPE